MYPPSPAKKSQEKGDKIRSCEAEISSSVNNLDNILRLAKNGSGLSAIVSKDVPLKAFVDLLRFRFEKLNHVFPVSVQSRLEEGVIEEVSIALDLSVPEYSVEALLLNAKKYSFTPQSAVASVAIVNSANLEVSVSGFGLNFEALKLLRSGDYCLAVLDWLLPDFHGLEVCKRISKEGKLFQ